MLQKILLTLLIVILLPFAACTALGILGTGAIIATDPERVSKALQETDDCWFCESGVVDCVLCADGISDCPLCVAGERCSYCNGRGSSACTVCNGAGWVACDMCEVGKQAAHTQRASSSREASGSRSGLARILTLTELRDATTATLDELNAAALVRKGRVQMTIEQNDHEGVIVTLGYDYEPGSSEHQQGAVALATEILRAMSQKGHNAAREGLLCSVYSRQDLGLGNVRPLGRVVFDASSSELLIR